METKYKIAIALVVVAIATSFAVGRYTVSEKIKIETKIVEVEKKTEKKDQDVNKAERKETTITESVKPDGTKETTTKIIEDTNTNKNTKVDTVQNDTTKTDASKTIEKGGSRLNISALGGYDIIKGVPVYGASISKDVIGPVSAGLWGLSNATVGISVGLSF